MANASSEIKLKPVFIQHLKIPKFPKNYTNFTLSVLYQWNSEAWMTVYLFTTWFIEYFRLIFETCCSKLKINFKILLIIHNAIGNVRALKEMSNEINVVALSLVSLITACLQ